MNKFLILFTFTVGSVLGFAVWGFISLPLSNPEGIVSALTNAGISPLTQSLRFLIFISLPTLLLFFLSKRSRHDPVEERNEVPLPPTLLTIFTTTALFLSLGCALVTPNASGKYDSFHEGEVLAAGVAASHGLIPYKDYRFIHGYVENPGRYLAAEEVFSRSVGAVRTVAGIQHLLCYLALSLVVLAIVWDRSALTIPLSLALVLLHSDEVRFLPKIEILPREFLPYLWIALSIVTIRRANSIYGFILGCVAPLMFICTVDRGYYALVGTLALPLFVSRIERSASFFLSIFLGFILGGTGLLLFFSESASDFLEYVFVFLPSTHDLNSGRVLSLGNVPLVVTITTFSAGLFWLLYRWKTVPTFFSSHRQELFLYLLSLLWFRSVLNRPDEAHLTYSITPLYLFWGSALTRHIFQKVSLPTVGQRSLTFVTSLISVFFLVQSSFSERFPLTAADEEILPPEYLEFALALEAAAIRPSPLYVLSIDSTWYYIFDTPPISGYTMSWFATTRRAQEEVVTRLNAIPELVILQRNGEEALDSVPLRERLPIIFRFVDEHFEEVFSHNAYRLLKRRGVQTIE